MTNNKRQTSVEWLIEQLEEKGKAYEENQVIRTINICIDVSDYMELKVQAQEMEKQQIRKAYCDGEHYKDTKLSTDYYKQTYGGGEQ